VSENVLTHLGLPAFARLSLSPRQALELWIAAERGRFLPWLPVFMGMGVLLFFAPAREPAPWLGPLIVLIALPTALLGWNRQLGRAFGLALLALALGFASASLRTHGLPPMPDLPRYAVIVSGSVTAVEPLPTGRRMVLSAVRLGDDAPLLRRLRVRIRGTDQQSLMPGDHVTVRALIRPPFAPTYPGGWDLRRDEFFAGLAGGGFALGPVQLAERATTSGIAARWQRFREGIAARIMAVVPGAAGAVAATLLTGINTAISPADRTAFATAGLAHILAVAGLHIGIVMSTVFVAVRFALAQSEWAALRWRIKEIAGIAAILVGAFYMAMTGMHLPIIRSFIMASLVTVGLLAGRRAISMRGLGLAATLLMLFQPEAVAAVSFQMSFSAVLVLVAGYEALQSTQLDAFAHHDGLLGWLRRDLTLVAVTSFLAAAATAPFVAYHFGQVQIYSVLANMLAVPLATFWVLPCGLAALLLMPLHLGFLALRPMGWGCDLLLIVARTVARLPAATISVPPEPLAGLCVASVGLIWLCLWRTRLRLLGVVPLICGVIVMPILTAPAPEILISPDLRIIAVRARHAVYLEQKGHDDFTLGEWRRFFGSLPLVPLPHDGAAGTSGVVCTADGCLFPATGALLWRAAMPPAHCDGISVIVTAGYLSPPDGRNCLGVPIIDRDRVEAGDAIMVRIRNHHAEIVADRPSRGTWPWIPSDQDNAN
jgi:competence protein ComEC